MQFIYKLHVSESEPLQRRQESGGVGYTVTIIAEYYCLILINYSQNKTLRNFAYL